MPNIAAKRSAAIQPSSTRKLSKKPERSKR